MTLSIEHELIVGLFRHAGELAPTLLRTLASIDLVHAQADPATINVMQVVPTEYRADSVVRLYDKDGKLTAAIVTEVQLHRDDDKWLSWPLYLAALRAQLRCPVYLLVVTFDEATAAWARRDIVLGHPGFVLRPIVICLADVPQVLNDVDANQLLELIVLSTLARKRASLSPTELAAIRVLPGHLRKLYKDVIAGTKRPARRRKR